MSIEFDSVYGYEVEDTEEIESFAYDIGIGSRCSIAYSGDPIPGFDSYAFGVPLYLGSDSEKELIDKIQKAKTILNEDVRKQLKEKFGITEEPRIIVMANAIW